MWYLSVPKSFFEDAVTEDDQHRLFYVDPEAQKGDFVELYAEIDLVCAISCCPGASSGSEPLAAVTVS